MSLQNNKEYALCVFDLDGTLTDTLEDLKNAVNHAMKSMGFPERTAEEVRRFVGNGMERLIERSVPENTDMKEYRSALALFREYYSAHMSDSTRPYDGIVKMLTELKKLGIKTAVVSNKDDGAVKKITEAFFGNLIDYSCGKRNGVPPKPDPYLLIEAVKAADCDVSDAIYAGDSDIDIETAHNVGIKCISVTWGFRDEELLMRSGADFIISSPDEILNIIK